MYTHRHKPLRETGTCAITRRHKRTHRACIDTWTEGLGEILRNLDVLERKYYPTGVIKWERCMWINLTNVRNVKWAASWQQSICDAGDVLISLLLCISSCGLTDPAATTDRSTAILNFHEAHLCVTVDSTGASQVLHIWGYRSITAQEPVLLWVAMGSSSFTPWLHPGLKDELHQVRTWQHRVWWLWLRISLIWKQFFPSMRECFCLSAKVKCIVLTHLGSWVQCCILTGKERKRIWFSLSVIWKSFFLCTETRVLQDTGPPVWHPARGFPGGRVAGIAPSLQLSSGHPDIHVLPNGVPVGWAKVIQCQACFPQFHGEC